MRLLIVTTVPSTLTAFLLPYADHFRALGWRVDAMANGVEACGVCRSRFDRVHDMGWSRSIAGNRRLFRLMRRVREVVDHEGYDVIHVHTPVASFIVRMALRARLKSTRPAIVYTVHGFHFQPGNNPLANAIFAAAERLAGRTTDFLVTMNRTDELAAADRHIVPAQKIRYMPGIGIDTDHFRPACVPAAELWELRRRLGIAEAAPLFVMIAEFHPRKRHEDLLAAFARMQAAGAHLLFVGAGALRAEVERRAGDLRIAGRIHFAGPQGDVRPYILAARATVLPSSQEGLPRSVMESLCCGVPVIASDIRGNRDLVAGGGGFLFPFGDTGALASHLDWFARNPDAAREMGLHGRSSVGIYATSSIIALHEELYAESTQGRSRDPRSTAVAQTRI